MPLSILKGEEDFRRNLGSLNVNTLGAMIISGPDMCMAGLLSLLGTRTFLSKAAAKGGVNDIYEGTPTGAGDSLFPSRIVTVQFWTEQKESIDFQSQPFRLILRQSPDRFLSSLIQTTPLKQKSMLLKGCGSLLCWSWLVAQDFHSSLRVYSQGNNLSFWPLRPAEAHDNSKLSIGLASYLRGKGLPFSPALHGLLHPSMAYFTF
jgi:hypothetical protein